MTVPKCTSWLGHHFVERHTFRAPAALLELAKMMRSAEVPYERIYERDICTRCGHVVERDQKHE